MRRVVVTGLGQAAPHGRNVATGFEALLAGRSAVGMHTVGEAPHALSLACAVAQPADAADAIAAFGRGRVATMDRVSQLSALAAQDAWQDAGLDAAGAAAAADVAADAARREQACVMWGTGGGGLQTLERGYRDLFLRGRARISPLSVPMGMNNAAAAHLAQLFGLGGACYTYSVACASSAAAIAEAARRIMLGDCTLALAGGGEAALPYATVRAWESMQVLAGGDAGDAEATAAACRPFDTRRRGLVLGEGAAALVLEEAGAAQARGARIYAELAGTGSSCDHAHLTAPQAEGQLRALRAALQQAGANPAEVAYVNAHGTGTTEGDLVECAALRQLLGEHASRVAVSATKSMHGHLMGAAGALEALVSVMAVHSGHIPPTAHLQDIDPACAGLDHVLGSGRRGVGVPLALSNSFAFGGSNVVLVFRRYEGP